jgi:hypothetical protein
MTENRENFPSFLAAIGRERPGPTRLKRRTKIGLNIITTGLVSSNKSSWVTLSSILSFFEDASAVS